MNFLTREIAIRMLSRLNTVLLQPQRTLQLDQEVDLLQQHYPNTQVLTDHLALTPQSVDLIFANLWLPWCADDLQTIFQRWRQLLHPQGLLMFTSFGPDTLKEWQDVVLPKRMDMHDVGDILLQTGWVDPVLDVERVEVTYRHYEQMIEELIAGNMITHPAAREQLEKNAEGVYSLTFEIVYGHAWGPGLSSVNRVDEAGTVKIPLSQLRGRKPTL